MLREVLVGAQAGAEAEPCCLLACFLMATCSWWAWAWAGPVPAPAPTSIKNHKINTQTGFLASLIKGIAKLKFFSPR